MKIREIEIRSAGRLRRRFLLDECDPSKGPVELVAEAHNLGVPRLGTAVIAVRTTVAPIGLGRMSLDLEYEDTGTGAGK